MGINRPKFKFKKPNHDQHGSVRIQARQPAELLHAERHQEEID